MSFILIFRIDRNCMASLLPNHDPTALDKYNDTLNGQIYNHDEQCMQNRNHEDSYLCRVRMNILNLPLL